MSSIKVRSLEVENCKKVRAVTLVPGENGLTIIGGDNMQGKTTVLDAICFALGGEKFRPSNLKREGSVADPFIKLELTNGLIVERKGKNSDLKVTDPSGKKAGQSLLDSFVETFALDLPKFLNASNKEKGNTLLKIIGVGDKLTKLDQEETKFYNLREAQGRIADQKEKYAKEMPTFADVPDELVTTSELMERQQAIMNKNAENAQLRSQETLLKERNDTAMAKVERLSKELAQAKTDYEKQRKEYLQAKTAAENLVDEPTDQLEAEMKKTEAINDKVRANLNKAKAVEDAEALRKDYNALTASIESVRTQRLELLNGAKMPLPEMSIEAGELTYKGKKWDCVSEAEQLQVATAIVRELKPQCGFVLLDGLEAMDMKTLKTFGAWLEKQDLQAIATRVSTGSECSIIIEDGRVQDAEEKPEKKKEEKKPAFTVGDF